MKPVASNHRNPTHGPHPEEAALFARPSRRMAAGTISPAAVLRDARKSALLRTRSVGFYFYPRIRHALAGAIVLGGALCGAAALLPVFAAEAPRTGAPPGLDLSAPGVAWAGFVAPKEPNYAVSRLFNDFASPATGLGPCSDGPDHPYANNEVAREMRIPPTYPVADLNNAAGKNLKPWVREALAKQNELVLRGRNGETREARCWGTGVPAFHLNPGLIHIIQTPPESSL